jgi:hypothetical protein
MTRQDTIQAVLAVHHLNSLAADFKMGIVPNDEIRAHLTEIFQGLGLDPDEVTTELQDAMACWGEWGDDENYLDSDAHLGQVE